MCMLTLCLEVGCLFNMDISNNIYLLLDSITVILKSHETIKLYYVYKQIKFEIMNTKII